VQESPLVQEDSNAKHIPIEIQPPLQSRIIEVTCENYLKRKMQREKSKAGKMKALKVIDTEENPLSPKIRKWLETRDKNYLVAFELRYKKEKVTILGSTNMRAAGLSSNFQNWYIDWGGRSITFLSLSRSPEFIFWDKNGSLRYFSITYGQEFLMDKDWDNPTVDLLQYSVSQEGVATLVSEELDVKCK
jgi:hypothetical protein